MNKFFNLASILGIILSGCGGFNVEAKRHVSAHSRKITTIKNGVRHTRKVHVKAHSSK